MTYHPHPDDVPEPYGGWCGLVALLWLASAVLCVLVVRWMVR